jgi:hypothetical protein
MANRTINILMLLTLTSMQKTGAVDAYLAAKTDEEAAHALQHHSDPQVRQIFSDIHDSSGMIVGRTTVQREYTVPEHLGIERFTRAHLAPTSCGPEEFRFCEVLTILSAYKDLPIEASQDEYNQEYLNEIRALLDAHPEFVNSPGSAFDITPVHTAACTPLLAVLEILLNYNPDLSLKNALGETALQRAQSMGMSESVKLLTDHIKQQQSSEMGAGPAKKDTATEAEPIAVGPKPNDTSDDGRDQETELPAKKKQKYSVETDRGGMPYKRNRQGRLFKPAEAQIVDAAGPTSDKAPTKTQ